MGPYMPYGIYGVEYDDPEMGGVGGGGGGDGMPDVELFENYANNFGMAHSMLMPFLATHAPICKREDKLTSDNCRPLYLPCKDHSSCAISCGVNDFACGRCSDTNSVRTFCQCCMPQIRNSIKK